MQVPIYVELGLTYVRWLVRGVAHREKNKQKYRLHFYFATTRA